MKTKLKVGVIGTGWSAGAHVEECLKMQDVEIVAVFNPNLNKAKDFVKKYNLINAKTYNSNKELIDSEKDLDAVFVCTPSRTHAEYSIYALKKGVNVLCEKPMSVTLKEAVKMCRAEKKSGKILSIGFQPRMDANMKKIKEIVESGVLGKIYYIQTGGGRRRGIPATNGTSFIEEKTAGIGAMGDIGCYSLDMVLNAIGYPKPLTVSGYTSNWFGKDVNCVCYPENKGEEYASLFSVEDFASAFIRLEGDIILDFRIAWAMNLDTTGDTIIMGTKGSLRIPSTEGWNYSIGGAMKIYSEVNKEQVVTLVPLLSNVGEGIFYDKIRTFLDAIIKGEKAPIPSDQILINQAIIDGVIKSSKLKKEIKINIPKL